MIHPGSEHEEDTHGGTLLTPAPPGSRFQLVETMLWNDGIALEGLHLDTMAASAIHFGWPFERASAERLIAIRIKTLQPTACSLVRLCLNADGSTQIRINRFVPPKRHGRVRSTQQIMAADDVFRLHQTTCRGIYDRLLPKARREGFDDLIFSNNRGELTEGAAHSFFIKRGNTIFTPPLHCGVLPGVYRRYVLETNPSAEEQVLRPSDLRSAETIYLTNSLVGMYPVELSI